MDTDYSDLRRLLAEAQGGRIGADGAIRDALPALLERIALLEAALYEISENSWTPAAIQTIQEIARAALLRKVKC